MEEIMQKFIVPTIAAVVYAFIEVIKTAMSGKEEWKKYIPMIAIISGGVIGGLFYSFAPELLPCDSFFMSVLMGCFSGLSATGINQVVKQLSAKSDTTNDDATKTDTNKVETSTDKENKDDK